MEPDGHADRRPDGQSFVIASNLQRNRLANHGMVPARVALSCGTGFQSGLRNHVRIGILSHEIATRTPSLSNHVRIKQS